MVQKHTRKIPLPKNKTFLEFPCDRSNGLYTWTDQLDFRSINNPIGSMYGIFTYIWLIFMVNDGKCS